ncbi:MAG: NADH-quinone oxidoreductase subunit C [Planctomycetota bacterium]
MSGLPEPLAALVDELPDGVRAVEDLRGEPAFEAAPGAARDPIRRLKGEGFGFLYLLTAVDNYPGEPRFEVVYGVRSLDRNLDVRLNVPLHSAAAAVPTVTDLFAAAGWMEREVYDMFGIRFTGHPNLTRILMWEGFTGWPLRKDYPLLGDTPGTAGHVGKGHKR